MKPALRHLSVLLMSILLLSTLAQASFANEHVLIYRGPGTCPNCAESIGDVLKEMPGVTFEYVRPSEITAERLRDARLYVQGAGTDDVTVTIRALGPRRIQLLRDFVARGGSYLGICAGAYLAGPTVDGRNDLRAFGFVSHELDPELVDTRAHVLPVKWRGEVIPLYYQAGPWIRPEGLERPDLWANYARSGRPAAVLGSWQGGKVGLVGPHPEATAEWFIEDHLPVPERTYVELAREFIRALLR